MKYVLTIIIGLFLSLSLEASSLGFSGIDTKTTINKYKQDTKKEKLSYTELLAFLKNSNDKNKIMILGVLYSHDSDKPDDYGNTIKADPVLAKQYLLESYKMGKKESLVILAGLTLYNDNMAKLDPKLDYAKKILIKSQKEGVKKGVILLAIVELIRGEYEEGLKSMTLSANSGDSSAQLELALIYQKGIFSEKEKKLVIKPERNVAEFYLNKACNNPIKADKVKEFCYSKSVLISNK